jgi:hypothetical protein
MATQGGAGSQLAALAAKRRTIDKTRQALGLNSGGGGSAGVARAPAPPPPPTAPGDSPVQINPSPGPVVPQPTDASTNTPTPDRNPQELQMVTDFLNQAKAQGKAVAPAGPPIQTAPVTQSPTLPEQITAAGADNYSPEMQFMRLAGRPPSGREMTIFNAVQSLTQQLGRAPTRNEVLLSVQNPVDMTTGPAPVAT